jgi:acyl carrier protein
MEIALFLKNFADILDDTDAGVILAETNFRDLDEWDSLTALSLIAMVDEEYGIKLTGEDIRTSITLTDIFNIVVSKS